MIEKLLIILIIGLFIVSIVLIYNIYLENQYRKKIYHQFGNSNKDPLLDANPIQVRDGQGIDIIGFKDSKVGVKVDLENPNEDIIGENSINLETDLINNIQDDNDKSTLLHDNKLLLNLEDLSKIELPWFDKKFDYMAYVFLKHPHELTFVPRFISRHKFTIVGCTVDDKFQIAESIPGVKYKGFVIGLQTISRNGLTTSLELESFGNKVHEFAVTMQGVVLLTNIEKFLNTAKILDKLCERVDQIIALHLVSRDYINAEQLKTVLEQNEFELSIDGAFYYPNANDGIFRIVNLDEEPFTVNELSTKKYKGFSMLFDITHVPVGEKFFNKFMELAVKFSSILELDLVDDKLEQLSTQWLKNIGTYVLERQEEMKSVGIIPGRELANRLFK